MTVNITVPPLGESVTEATVAKWYKKAGDAIKMDEILVELETDKVTLEVAAPANGVLTEIKSEQGSTVSVGDLLGLVKKGAAGAASAAPVAAANIAAPVATTSMQTSAQTPIMAPSAAKIAKENNIDANNVAASGKDGRITKGDVLEAVAAPKASAEKREEIVPMTRLRKRIAERLKESQNTAAMLTTFNEVDMSGIMEIRAKYKDMFEKKHGIKLGFMSFFVKAAIVALQEIPAVNAEMRGDNIVYKNFYDIGVAVGTEQGLVVPIVRDADNLSFAGVEKTIVGLGKKARDGKLSMADMTGGTFTISNGGVYGSLMSTPIINPPQSAILGMHKTMDRPVVVNGKIEIRPMMYLALSYDHRLIDGKEAVTFLVRVKECIENPERILFDL
jgi:2-oxoglutarate dehydrogenase E2 component (dihydrolipoamide succinyltransferase)